MTKETPMTEITTIAKVAHAANRAWCEEHGDTSQLPWEQAPAWQRESCEEGVSHAIRNPGGPASTQHDAWLATKLREGWTWGPKKDPEKKQHPNMVPFESLPPHEQAKDRLFKAIVEALSR
jgi:hypothetical protein